MTRIIGLLFLSCFAFARANEILSLGSFKSKYAATVSSGFAAANSKITGTIQPEESDQQLMWRWYRNVDPDSRALAKTFMDSQVVATSTSSLAVVTDFQTKYTAVVDAVAVDETTVADKALLMEKVLASARPVGANAADLKNQAAWDAYHALSTSQKAEVKGPVIYKPFITAFEGKWNTAWTTANNFEKVLQLASTTMTEGATPATATKTQPFWKALTQKELRTAMQKHMFTGDKSVGMRLTT